MEAEDEGPETCTPHLRHPGTASERSEGRRIRDPCRAVHAGNPVHDEARAARCRRRSTVAAISSSVIPPSVVATRRHLRPHCVGWRIRWQRRRPSSNPTKWGGGAERSEAEGGTPPPRAGSPTGLPRPAWPPPRSSSRNDVRAQRRTTYPGSMPRPSRPPRCHSHRDRHRRQCGAAGPDITGGSLDLRCDRPGRVSLFPFRSSATIGYS